MTVACPDTKECGEVVQPVFTEEEGLHCPLCGTTVFDN